MTYGIPHTVRGWDPTDIVTTVDIDEYDLSTPEGFTAVILSGTESGPVILVPTVALTPVDTTPAEPEPGAWDVNGVLCIRDTGSAPTRWYWCLLNEGRSAYTSWKGVWAKHGAPGITPRRLVPEPATVTLPYSLFDIEVDVTAGGVRLSVDEVPTFCSPDSAEQHGWALISAARAAREVKP